MAPLKRKNDFLADKILIAFIARINGNRNVAHHRFRTRRRNLNIVFPVESILRINERIFHVVESTFVILVNDFDV